MKLRWLWFDYSDPELPLSFWRRMRVAFRFVPIWKLPAKIWIGRVLFLLAILPLMFLPQIAVSLISNFTPSDAIFLSVGLLVWIAVSGCGRA
jgi:hypothetical protein